MATLHVVLACVVLLLLLPVKASYNCSQRNMVIEIYTFDFLRTFDMAATEVRDQAPKIPDRFMNFTQPSEHTNRNVTVWSQCDANSTENYCATCLSIVFSNIYDVCCQGRSVWGIMNLRASCNVGYSAPDYLVSGWTDRSELPKGIQEKPKPLDLNAAQGLAPSHIVFHLVTSTLACIFSTLFGVY